MNSPQPQTGTNIGEYSVSEISGALKRMVEDTFGHVRVRGEISGYRGPHSSGHAYFALKDERARIEAVIWKGTFSRLRFKPEEGMEVIATGKLTTYPGSSKYQIVIESIEPAGAGALMALLEERRKKLAAEGLFDAGRKQLIPHMPKVVGVVTSPTGAVIRDIIHRITDRFPLHVIVWPVRVQGETTGAEVSAAVAGFNALPEGGPIPRPDVLIVARGGGSLEDLWGFNDEAVVRAVADSDIPVISAVGHETDWTLIDHAADIRAPTPTGAAEMAVPVRAELESTLASLGARLKGCISRSSERKRERLRACARALPSADQLLAMPRRRFDEAASRLDRGFSVLVERRKARLQKARLSPATLQQRVAEARRRLEREADQLPKCARAFLRNRRNDLDRRGARLRLEPIETRSRNARERLAGLAGRKDRAVDVRGRHWRERLFAASRMLGSLSYTNVLARGYALVRDEAGLPVTRGDAVKPGDRLAIQFADRSVDALAAKSKPSSGTAARPPSPPQGGQGTLL
ncbi:exodeoxyribonuclease VII large subunit [Chelativorans sp. ZYF759]|uniref:exodeoxyribonuclease VII large subunit n=1 Tax=Chelativorans sp. ZYF759 TaxID=2692213 RepID=UPI00145F41F9|nr:exodeoxyribonuclease VII large subunit [Chelativorans sp. ZYF759]NMG40782.1 exodeoxyribonuclease VII large subunit [Chelativorans sp. ZYF759]